MSQSQIASVIGHEQDGWTDGPPICQWAENPPISFWAEYFREQDGVRFDMEFPRMHAMIHWLHSELWKCTADFVQEHKLIEKADPQAYVYWSKEAHMLELTEWKLTEERELTDWTFLIGHTKAPAGAFRDGFSSQEGVEDSIMEFLRSADAIRHAAAHHWSTGVGDLFRAMLLPRLLKDGKRADRIERIFYAISDEAGHFFDDSTRKEAELTIFTPPCNTVHQKLARLESLLQPVCFEYAQRVDPELLSSKNWDVPEKVEISKLGDWRYKKLQQDDFPDEKFDFEAFYGTVAALQTLRNCVWHRNPVSDTEFVCFVHAGIRFATYTGNRAKAIEIEIEAEMMLTGKARDNVLTRLHKVYLAVDLPSNEDDRRRECRRRVAIDKVLEDSSVEISHREVVTIWSYMFRYPRPEEPYQEDLIEDDSVTMKRSLNNVEWLLEEDIAPEEIYQEAYPEERYPEERYPEERYPEERYPEERYPEERYSEERYPEERYSEETDSQILNPNDQNGDWQRDPSFVRMEASPSGTLFTPDPNSTPRVESPPTAIPGTALQGGTGGTANAAEEEDNIHNLEGNVGLGIDDDPHRDAASTDSAASISLFTFSPSMHECLKW